MPLDTLAPYSWPRNVRWCLAEGYRKWRSAPPHGPIWLGKDLTIFYWRLCMRSCIRDQVYILGVVRMKVKPYYFLDQKIKGQGH